MTRSQLPKRPAIGEIGRLLLNLPAGWKLEIEHNGDEMTIVYSGFNPGGFPWTYKQRLGLSMVRRNPDKLGMFMRRAVEVIRKDHYGE